MSQEYCSILTQKLKADGCGTAPPNTKYFLFVETPKPWPENEKSHPSYPNYAYDLAKGNLKIHLLSPGSFSKDKFKKILFFKVSDDNMGFFNRKEYQIPEEKVPELINVLFKNDSNDNPSEFEFFREKSENIRDFFICGHLAKDYCCGTFGNALYEKTLEKINKNPDSFKNIKFWQTSHVKGHKFAPTMIDFPEGRFWAHMNENILFDQIIPLMDLKDLSNLRLHIRGLASTSPFGQIAERELLLEYGPSWSNMKRIIKVTEDPSIKNKATVQIIFDTPSGKQTNNFAVSYTSEAVVIADHACGETSTFKNSKVEKL